MEWINNSIALRLLLQLWGNFHAVSKVSKEDFGWGNFPLITLWLQCSPMTLWVCPVVLFWNLQVPIFWAIGRFLTESPLKVLEKIALQRICKNKFLFPTAETLLGIITWELLEADTYSDLTFFDEITSTMIAGIPSMVVSGSHKRW